MREPEDAGAAEEPEDSAFGAALRRHRRAAGLTQEALAERAGVGIRTVQGLEAGTSAPLRGTARRLAAGLALPPAARARFLAAAAPPPRARRTTAPPSGGLRLVPPPPARPGLAPPGALPAAPSSFVGREADLAAARRTLLRGDVRLLTLLGPPGVGKTRLALALAGAVGEAFADGVRLVRLAPVAEAALVLPTIARVLGIVETGGQPLPDAVRTHLAGRELLLVLDNLEQVLPAAPQVAELLAAAPALKVLATSRVALRVAAEHRFVVPPLGVPDATGAPPLAEVAGTAAVRLFVARVQAADPGFALTAENAAAVAELCRRLDGLPLALELAAARAALLSPAALLARLEARLPLLTGGARDLPAHQQTLRATLDWSHALLAPEERVLFRRLSVFVGGCTLEAADAVAPAGAAPPDATGSPTGLGPPPGVLDGLERLVDSSLLQREAVAGGAAPAGAPRLTMLETVREFALEQLEASGEANVLGRRHARWCLDLVEQAEPELKGPRQVAWLDRLDREHGNLRAALHWCLTQGEAETGLRIGGALHRFWHLRSYLAEGRAWLTALLSLPDPAPPAARARALFAAGVVALAQGDVPATRAHSRASAAIWGRLSNPGGRAHALGIVAAAALRAGDPAAAALAAEGVRQARASGNPQTLAYSLYRLGTVAAGRRRPEAQALFAESLALFRQVGDWWFCALVLNAVAGVSRTGGDDDAVRACYAEALAQWREIGDRRGVAVVLHNQASFAAQQGAVAPAAAGFAESLAAFRDAGDRHGVGWCLAGLAGAAAAAGDPERAARLFAAATPWLTAVAEPLHPASAAARDRAVQAARRRLGDAAFAHAWAAGQAAPLEQAVAEALGVPEAMPRPPAGARPPAREDRYRPLSAREREVAGLVAQGLSDREIAARLTITARTAENHVGHILTKLGFRSRVQIATWASVHGPPPGG
jgi:predicted ATPase/DNA-binding CsgD family transcriptional regulator/transcriptional regulator with XRE-family HTH domain